VSYLATTQNSLPVAGQALPDGISTRKVPLKGFKVADYISFPFPKLAWRNCIARSEFGRKLRCALRRFCDYFAGNVQPSNCVTYRFTGDRRWSIITSTAKSTPFATEREPIN